MLISMARYGVETGWRVVMNFFFVVGVVWSVDSLAKKVQSFDYLISSIPTITVRHMSLSFSLSFIRRPLVDIIVFCISFILFISFKRHNRHRRAPRKQSQETEKVSDGRLKVIPPPLLTYHHPQEKSEPYASSGPLPSEKKSATHPRSSVETIPRPRVEDSPPPPEKKKHEDAPTSSLSTQFRRTPIRNKSHGAAEAPVHQTGTFPPVNRSPRPPRHAAAMVSTNPPPALPALQPRRFLDRQRPTENDASRPQLNGARGLAAWTLERQAVLEPSTWKPVPHFRDEQAIRPGEDQVCFFAGASTTAGIPVPSAPPWPGYAEDDYLEAHDSMDELWRAITTNRALKKSETWSKSRGHETESSSEDTRMNKWETCNESSSSRALPQRDSSIGAEEMRKLADEFITKMRNDLWLQRQESEQCYKEMINRSTL